MNSDKNEVAPRTPRPMPADLVLESRTIADRHEKLLCVLADKMIYLLGEDFDNPFARPQQENPESDCGHFRNISQQLDRLSQLMGIAEEIIEYL